MVFIALQARIKGDVERIKREIYRRKVGNVISAVRRGPLFELHEFWEYYDGAHVQKLVGIHHLCRLCHMIKHIGFWCYTSNGRKKLEKLGLSRKDLIEHFCRVNNCSEEDFERHEDEAFKSGEGDRSMNGSRSLESMRDLLPLRNIEVESNELSSQEKILN